MKAHRALLPHTISSVPFSVTHFMRLACLIALMAFGGGDGEMAAPGHISNHREQQVLATLKSTFGYETLRGRQRDVINTVLDGLDAFAIMPTGAGKSLCYQLPAVMASDKVAVIVTPLISLMLGQVESLRKKGVPVASIYSAQGKKVRDQIMNSLHGRESICDPPSAPKIRLLYVSPELLLTSGFETELLSLYQRGVISLFAIDEAHCVSEFGHEFRPSYRRLGAVHRRFGQVPWLALTATATARFHAPVVPPHEHQDSSGLSPRNPSSQGAFGHTSLDRISVSSWGGALLAATAGVMEDVVQLCP